MQTDSKIRIKRWKYTEAIHYLNSFIDFERHPEPRLQTEAKDIDRFRQLLGRLGDPHLSYPTIHITGTKGKGSTSAMLASVLQSAGLKVGLYTSPHLVSVRERIMVSGKMISKRDFASVLQQIAVEFEALREDTTLAFRTVFELLTASGFLEFQRNKVDIAIIEAGLGAKLDATIVVEPILAVVTPIGLDHTQVLGDTVELIAADKSHVIKKGVTAISAPQVAGVAKELSKRARQFDSKLVFAPGRAELTVLASTLKGSEVTSDRAWLEQTPLKLALSGDFQLTNLSVVLSAVEQLKKQGFPISAGAVEAGLSNVRWPGRMQTIKQNPKVILDGAHNSLAIEAFVFAVASLVKAQKPQIVFSSIIGKPVDEMVRILASIPGTFHIAPLQFPKGLQIETLRSAVSKAGGSVVEYSTVPEAFEGAKHAAGRKGLVLATGSLYLVGELLRYLKGLPLSIKNGGIDDSV